MFSPLMGNTNPIQYPQAPSRVMPQPVGPAPWGGQPPGRVNPIGDPRQMPLPRVPIGPMAPAQGTFKKGGKVPKTGKYILHAGERVIPKGKRKAPNRGPEKMVSVAALKA